MKKKLLCFKWAFHSCIATPRNTCLCSPKQLFNGKWRLYGSSMLYLQTGTESDMSMLVHVCNEQLFLSVQMCFVKKQTSKNISAPVISQEIILLLPLWLKRPSISMEDLEWAMQSMEQGTMPSWAGERSVVRTKHQSGLSCSRSKTSTVWPRRTVSSPLLPPLLATKSCMTTVSSQPPESWKGNNSTLNVFSRG